MTLPHCPQPPANGNSVALSHRACQSCGTTVTSQWRYGLSGKILLCNACGIKWKRKNRNTDKRRLKPGPKRTRQCTTINTAALYAAPYSAPLPPILQPSLASMFCKSTAYSTINTNISPCTSTLTDSRADMAPNPKSFSQQQSSTGYTRRCSKMDLGRLMCPTNTTATIKRDEREYSRPSRNTNSSAISINNLLNFTDDDGTSTVCSTTTPYRTPDC